MIHMLYTQNESNSSCLLWVFYDKTVYKNWIIVKIITYHTYCITVSIVLLNDLGKMFRYSGRALQLKCFVEQARGQEDSIQT